MNLVLASLIHSVLHDTIFLILYKLTSLDQDWSKEAICTFVLPKIISTVIMIFAFRINYKLVLSVCFFSIFVPTVIPNFMFLTYAKRFELIIPYVISIISYSGWYALLNYFML